MAYDCIKNISIKLHSKYLDEMSAAVCWHAALLLLSELGYLWSSWTPLVDAYHHGAGVW
jgi:hypothetical protein